MSNILAGIGRGQLRVLEDRVAARRMVYERYRENLAHIQAIRWMPEPEWSFSTRWLSVCMLDSKVSTTTPSDVIELLARNGIEARRVWKPMHKQPLFHGAAYYGHTPEWSFADVAFETGVCLPSGSNMSEVQQSRIVRLIESILT
jgi:dTDP-4-amino-4,6-dideoxygalactose transaminase